MLPITTFRATVSGSFAAVTFDLYRTIRRHLHWTLQNLVRFADCAGNAFPSVRTLATVTGTPKSTVSRHLAQLVEEGVVTRTRSPGGAWRYVIAKAWLPAGRGVSHQREKGVPPARREEQAGKKTDARARDRFVKKRVSFGELTDEHGKWAPRVRSWQQSRFWLPLWGPRPDEAGCFAPVKVLALGG